MREAYCIAFPRRHAFRSPFSPTSFRLFFFFSFSFFGLSRDRSIATRYFDTLAIRAFCFFGFFLCRGHAFVTSNDSIISRARFPRCSLPRVREASGRTVALNSLFTRRCPCNLFGSPPSISNPLQACPLVTPFPAASYQGKSSGREKPVLSVKVSRRRSTSRVATIIA